MICHKIGCPPISTRGFGFGLRFFGQPGSHSAGKNNRFHKNLEFAEPKGIAKVNSVRPELAAVNLASRNLTEVELPSQLKKNAGKNFDARQLRDASSAAARQEWRAVLLIGCGCGDYRSLAASIFVSPVDSRGTGVRT